MLELTDPFDDLTMAEDDTEALDMADHFSGEGLTYEVAVTTVHQGTGETRSSQLNEIARNKVTGAWNGSVLTLTAGHTVSQELTLTITATDNNGVAVSDEFTLTLDNG